MHVPSLLEERSFLTRFEYQLAAPQDAPCAERLEHCELPVYRGSERRCSLYRGRIAHLCRVRSWRKFVSKSSAVAVTRSGANLPPSRSPALFSSAVNKLCRECSGACEDPSRVQGRSPAGSRAAVQRSERTTSHEDSCIRSTGDGPPTSLQPRQNRIVKMQPWSKANLRRTEKVAAMRLPCRNFGLRYLRVKGEIA